MAYITNSSEFKSAIGSVIRSQKQLDAQLTELGASAILNALNEIKAGRPGTSVWANYMLHMCENYDVRQAALLRNWLVAYGPFLNDKERNLDLLGEKLIVKAAVKFSEKKAKALFSQQEPEWYADRAKAVDFRTYKKVTSAETKVEKTDDEKREDILKKLDSLKKSAAKLGMTITDKPVIAGVPTFNELVSILGRMANESSLKPEELIAVRTLLDSAIDMYAKMASKAA